LGSGKTDQLWLTSYNRNLTDFCFPRALSPEPRAYSKGFTLIELLIVLVLISITAALIVPRLPSTESMELKSSARTTATMLRYLGERSIGSKNIYRLRINMTDNSLSVTRKLQNGDEIPPDDPLLSRKAFAKGITIADLESPRLGKVNEGEVTVDFGAAGLAEFLTLHLCAAKGECYTVAGYPQGGKVKLLSGYQEVTL
jgi:general secretion pathway protein H